ncbi:MAG: carboxypeptidase [Elusimicrobia bacterium GWC2_61_19]|nr:MAG: carboxypeptidase [Elusimicrobia bacterium GWC2_61_19]
MEPKFQELKKKLSEVSAINSAAAVLSWDQQVYMPPGGAEARGAAISTLEELGHVKFTAPETGKLIDETYAWAQGLGEDSFEASYLRAARRDYDKAVKLPAEFVGEFSRATSAAIDAWAKARANSDFKAFAPHLQKILDLNLRKAQIYGYKASPYDALLDLYEPGATKAMLEPIFKKLTEGLKPIIKEINARAGSVSNDIVKGDFDEQAQLALVNEIAGAIGYDFTRGRQDRSAHPFTTDFSVNDVRITTRTHRDYLPAAIYGSIHEAGHALYGQGTPKNFDFTPLAGGASLGVHESQSRFWENIVGRSLPFCRWLLPLLRKHFPGKFDKINAEELYVAVNRSAPSMIRVESDEVNYNLHIMLRFEIETALLEGKLKVADAPAFWNARMRDYFGITPAKDAEGILQDIHWSLGAMGYFPTYTLGNLISAQLAEKMNKDIPGWKNMPEKGDFAPILAWLRKHIHSQGRKYLPEQLLKRELGEGLKVEPFLHYIKDKYSKIYGF